MDYNKLAELLFGHITKTPADYEAIYPKRELGEEAKVTRFAPSPTGFLHIGGLFLCHGLRLLQFSPFLNPLMLPHTSGQWTPGQ